MSQRHEKLKTLLKELFQLDQPDLDFGFYRVMHARSAEVTQFLEKDLLPQVKAAFAQYQPADKAAIEKELAKAIEQAQALGADPETLPKVKELRAKLADDAVDLEALEAEVYDHLYSFFRRYYSDGDFLSKRVYKPGVYAIPYEGEEVKLHWANADQYYIKTAEYLRDYAFRLRPDDEKNPMRVHFRLLDASEGEHGNVKEAAGKERRFRLGPAPFAAVEGGELVIRFTYETDPAKQKELNANAETAILGLADLLLAEWLKPLGAKHVRADGTASDATRLRVHLDRYTARNTFDYFIHKDLGGFLSRELDFYIKNEVMYLDDVECDTPSRVEQYLSKIRVIRRIARKIIEFLVQLENFQRKLWLKGKFVVETSYLIAIRAIPVGLHRQVLQNDAQTSEWTRLSMIHEDAATLSQLANDDTLAAAFFDSHPTLLVDTRHFAQQVAAEVIASVPDLQQSTNAVLIAADNVHALRLIRSAYSNVARSVYIDPPYNTGSDGFMFRDAYRHSSWLTMMSERLEILRELMAPDGVLFASIDANERAQLEATLIEIFGERNRVEELIWVQNTTKNQSPTYSTNHEYIEVFARNLQLAKAEFRRFREVKPGLKELQDLLDTINPSYLPIRDIEARIAALYREHTQTTRAGSDDMVPDDTWKGLTNYSHAEYRDADGRLVDESTAKLCAARIWVWRESDTSMPQVKEDSQRAEFREPDHPAYRFYKPIHPITKKPCLTPKRGWAWPLLPHGRQSFCFSELAKDDRIVWGPNELKVPQIKTFVHEVRTNVAKSVVVDYTDGEKQLANLFGRTRAFSNPKPSTLLQRLVEQSAWSTDVVIDCFAGSGTLGEAVIAANRNDGGRRRCVLIEAGAHFDSVLLPRIKKVAFAPEWRDGVPRRPASEEDAERGPTLIKVLRLESFDDTLNNLELRRSQLQQMALDAPEAQGADRLKEQYMLRYVLDVETRDNPSLLTAKAFVDPTAYHLSVRRPGSDERREVVVDLVETFNWLLGLSVQHIAAPEAFTAECQRDGQKRLVLAGRLRPAADGPHWFRTVTGTTREGQRALIIWRKLTGEPEQDNLVLDHWFAKQRYSSADAEVDVIYVNGSSNLKNLKDGADRWKVRSIEEEFHRLMFQTEGA